MALDDDALREAAGHRGFKLVKSRRRKPGIGDYGRFGLTDMAGKPLFGVGEQGLTATAREIADFLRKGEASTWAQSARVMPAQTRKRKASEDEPPRHKSSAKPKPVRQGSVSKLEAPPVVAAEPDLQVRPARKVDAGPIATLLAMSGSEAAVARDIEAAERRKEPILVADRGGMIGFLAWHAIPTVHEGPIGRITAIIVLESARRGGVARALVEAFCRQASELGCRRIEAMSEIAVRNANGFYRALGLAETGYRFSYMVSRWAGPVPGRLGRDA